MKHFLLFLGILSILVSGTAVRAHGPSLKLDKTVAASGEEVTIRGEGITKNGEIRLTLQGMLQDYALGSAQGDEHGRFQNVITLPSGLSAGDYTLLAAGDQKATARITLQNSKEKTVAAPAAEERAGHAAHESGEAGVANPEPMDVERSTAGTTRALAWMVTLVSGLLGVALMLRSSRK
jgi:hypothetical protein